MDVRLVASDLDGTLFGPDHVPTARTVASVAALAERGVRIIAATGRSHRTALPRLQEVPAVEAICASNGAATWHVAGARFLATRCIDDDLLPVVVERLRSSFPTMVHGWESIDGFGWEKGWKDRRDVGEWLANPAWTVGPLDPTLHTGLLKIMAWDDELQREELVDAVTERMPDGVVCTTSGADFVEITGDGVDKAAAVAAWCATEGIEASEVVAFGDQHNDIPLLRWAGRGVAMGNAHPDVQAIADDVIGTNTVDAFAHAIDEL